MNEQTRPDVQRQMVFAEGGEIEPEEGPVGTSLEDFRADVDHRPEVRRSKTGEQGALFTSADEDQRTLAGEKAAGRSLF